MVGGGGGGGGRRRRGGVGGGGEEVEYGSRPSPSVPADAAG